MISTTVIQDVTKIATAIVKAVDRLLYQAAIICQQTTSGDKHTPADEEAYSPVITALCSQHEVILLKKNNPLFCIISWITANNTAN